MEKGIKCVGLTHQNLATCQHNVYLKTELSLEGVDLFCFKIEHTNTNCTCKRLKCVVLTQNLATCQQIMCTSRQLSLEGIVNLILFL